MAQSRAGRIPPNSSTSSLSIPITTSSTSTIAQTSTTTTQLTPKEIHDISIARIMFIAGCFLLPWLWIANLVYYRHRIFDSHSPPELRKCTYLIEKVKKKNRCSSLFPIEY